MSIVSYQQQSIDVDGGETLLTAFEKAGVQLPNSCRAGLCQACLMVLKKGVVPPVSQKGLDDQQVKQKLFFACQCKPDSDIEVALPSDDFYRSAELSHKSIISNGVLRVRFKTSMNWQAGQFTTVWKSPMQGRTFSIASLSESGELELHIRRRENGVISHWLETELKVGDQCQLSEAKGGCFYNLSDLDAPIVLAGTGTGLSPLYGVLQEALKNGHRGKIALYAAAGEPSQLYLTDELRALTVRYDNFNYYAVVRRNGDIIEANLNPHLLQGDLVDLVLSRHKDMAGHAVFVCGAPNVVNKLKKMSFLQGASMKSIFADAFEGGNDNK